MANFLIDEAELQEQYILDTEAGMLSRTIFNGERQPNPELTEVECAVEGLDLVCNEKTLLRSHSRIVIGVNRYLPFAYTIAVKWPDQEQKRFPMSMPAMKATMLCLGSWRAPVYGRWNTVRGTVWGNKHPSVK